MRWPRGYCCLWCGVCLDPQPDHLKPREGVLCTACVADEVELSRQSAMALRRLKEFRHYSLKIQDYAVNYYYASEVTAEELKVAWFHKTSCSRRVSLCERVAIYASVCQDDWDEQRAEVMRTAKHIPVLKERARAVSIVDEIRPVARGVVYYSGFYP